MQMMLNFPSACRHEQQREIFRRCAQELSGQPHFKWPHDLLLMPQLASAYSLSWQHTNISPKESLENKAEYGCMVVSPTCSMMLLSVRGMRLLLTCDVRVAISSLLRLQK
jgi:hypothetical protein